MEREDARTCAAMREEQASGDVNEIASSHRQRDPQLSQKLTGRVCGNFKFLLPMSQVDASRLQK